MIVELQLFQYRIVLTAAKTDLVEAVYSQLDDNMHFLMWDFDNATLREVEDSLIRAQDKFQLSHIYIVETRKDKGYHAYCLQKRSYEEVTEILAATERIDLRFVAAGIIRRKWTLRLGKKFGRTVQCVSILSSPYPETAKIDEIKNFCVYKTPNNKHKTRVIKIGVK